MWQNSGGMPRAPGAAANPNDWASAAVQWMENKKYYEQWQQQQYHQHLQMMAATHAAQMAQSIDPTVVNNPPPPPPLPEINTEGDNADLSKDKKENDYLLEDNSDIKPSSTPSKFKNQHLINNPKTALLASAAQAVKNQRPNLSKQSVFAAFDKNGVPTAKDENFEKLYAEHELNQDMSEKSQKQLPLWLREGLEKIKQEKQKKETEKPKPVETKPTIQSVFGNDDDDDSEEELHMSRKDKLSHPIPASKNTESKLTSHAKNGKMPSSSGKISDFPVSNGKQHGISQHESTNKIELNDDEKQELIMALLKQWMTEILLDVTNSEMQTVAKQVIQFEKDVRHKEQLKTTKASLNISYAADSSDDSDSDESTRSDRELDQEEDAEFLKKRAETKLKEYERKFMLDQEKQAAAELAKQKQAAAEKNSQRSRRDSRSFTRSRSRSRSGKRSRRSRTRSRSRSRRRSRRGRRSYSRSYSRSRTRSRSARKDRGRRYDDYSDDDYDRGKKASRYRRSRSRSVSRHRKRASYRSKSRSITRSRSRSRSYRRSKKDRSRSRTRSRSRSYKKKSTKSRRSRSNSSSANSSRSRSRSYVDKSDSSRNSSPSNKKSKKKSKKSKR